MPKKGKMPQLWLARQFKDIIKSGEKKVYNIAKKT